MKKIRMVFAMIPFLFACANADESEQRIGNEFVVKEQELLEEDKQHSKDSLDWHGMYSGVLPCLDSAGIRVTLTLQEGTYKLARTSLEKDSFTRHSEGAFIWNEDGSIITLLGVKDEQSQYKVEENRLIQLDGKEAITLGTMAERSVLTKGLSPILNIAWKLRELQGRAVETVGMKPFNLILDTVVGSAHGYGGCNGFAGEFEVKGDKLQLFDVFITEMGCDSSVMEIERVYVHALREIDNFRLEGDVLLLKKSEVVVVKFEKQDGGV